MREFKTAPLKLSEAVRQARFTVRWPSRTDATSEAAFPRRMKVKTARLAGVTRAARRRRWRTMNRVARVTPAAVVDGSICFSDAARETRARPMRQSHAGRGRDRKPGDLPHEVKDVLQTSSAGGLFYDSPDVSERARSRRAATGRTVSITDWADTSARS